MNPFRLSAKASFDNASKAVREFNGTDVSEWNRLNAIFTEARDRLISEESAHPTAREINRRKNALRLENMGLMS